MQALVLTKSGHPTENFNLVNDFPKPQAPGKGDVLVKIHATALNPVDYKQAQYGFLISGFPAVLGCTRTQHVTWHKKANCAVAASSFFRLLFPPASLPGIEHQFHSHENTDSSTFWFPDA